MRETGKSKTCVRCWQERFAAEGVGGLLRDKTRPSRIPKLDPSVGARVVALTIEAPPSEATHWTGAGMAEAAGVSVTSVQRIWRVQGLQPHRVQQFKLSKDPEFVAKLRDVLELYVDPPAHALMLSVDEKSQIQALDRTQPNLHGAHVNRSFGGAMALSAALIGVQPPQGIAFSDERVGSLRV
jgi:Homeodomain-like domain